jgi:hypothetical protein
MGCRTKYVAQIVMGIQYLANSMIGYEHLKYCLSFRNNNLCEVRGRRAKELISGTSNKL